MENSQRLESFEKGAEIVNRHSYKRNSTVGYECSLICRSDHFAFSVKV